MRRNVRALSPVIASIILITVTIAVSIAVAAWMGALTFTFMTYNSDPKNMIFSNNYGKVVFLCDQNNITIIKSTARFDGAIYYNNYNYNYTEFIVQAKLNNVSFILSDYKNEDYPYPKFINLNTLYSAKENHFWYYVTLPNVGDVAMLLRVQENWTLKP